MSGEQFCTLITRISENIDEGLWKLIEGVSVKLDWGHQRRPAREWDILADWKNPGKMPRILKISEEKGKVFPAEQTAENPRNAVRTSPSMKLEHT